MSKYEAPKLTVLGELRTLTLGGPHSCADGNSGSTGNNSQNSGACTHPR